MGDRPANHLRRGQPGDNLNGSFLIDEHNPNLKEITQEVQSAEMPWVPGYDMDTFNGDLTASNRTTELIEAWFRRIEDTHNPHGDEVLINTYPTMSNTPSPKKRPRITSGVIDLDATPRQAGMLHFRDSRLQETSS